MIRHKQIWKTLVSCALIMFFSLIFAQDNTGTGTMDQIAQEQTINRSNTPVYSEQTQTVPQAKPDALKLYREGRDLESAGKTSDARAKYQRSAEVCRLELKENSKNIESFVVLGWALIRLGQYSEVITISNEALKINSREYRIIESLGEAYFYIDNYPESLKYFEQYLHALPNGDRASTAYFFVGDIFRLTGRYEHADIAYSTALAKTPNMALWWYRLGSVRELAGKKAEARAAYEKALQYKPIYQEASDALKRLS